MLYTIAQICIVYLPRSQLGCSCCARMYLQVHSELCRLVGILSDVLWPEGGAVDPEEVLALVRGRDFAERELEMVEKMEQDDPGGHVGRVEDRIDIVNRGVTAVE